MSFDNVDDINYVNYKVDENSWKEKLELTSNGSTISIDLFYPSIFLETDMCKTDIDKKSEKYYPWNNLSIL